MTYKNEEFGIPQYGTRETAFVCFIEIYNYCCDDPLLVRKIKTFLTMINEHCNFTIPMTILELKTAIDNK